MDVATFTMSADVQARLFAYDAQRAKEIATQELVRDVPPNKILVSFIEERYHAAPSDSANAIQVDVAALVQPKISEFALKSEDIVGMNEEEVKDHFTKITGVRDVQVSFSPFWVRSVPNLEDHVDIEIKK